MSSAAAPCLRIRIHGELTCRSALHIGSGASEPIAGRDRTCAASAANADPGEFAAVCAAHDGLPYLPGSTLRGFLRGQVRRWRDQSLERRLFGYVDDKPGADEIKRANAGALRI